MVDATLLKDLTELLSNNLTFPEMEIVGGYFFKKYDSHTLEGISKTVTISPGRAARRLVQECIDGNKIEELIAFTVELDDNQLNGRTVRLAGLDNLLYTLSRSGHIYDHARRRLVKISEDANLMPNWGVLRDGKEYPLVIASMDICGNSKLVKKYGPKVMEKVYLGLWEFFKPKMRQYNARMWYWAGDGGVLAFRDQNGGAVEAVSCCLEMIFSLSVYNCSPDRQIDELIAMRFGMDAGRIKFFNKTGRIVSDVINYACHLEKNHTDPNGISVSGELYERLTPQLRYMFKKKDEFESRTAYSLTYDCNRALC